MDAMALLCTLHADGPATLKRLRQSGCASLDTLCALDDARLASMLATTPASARRLQREAELLRERLGGAEATARRDATAARSMGALGADGSTSAVAPFRDAMPMRGTDAPPFPIAHEPREERSAASPGESVPLDGVDLESRERRLMARVLETWRARDAEEDEAPGTSSAPVTPLLSTAPPSTSTTTSTNGAHRDGTPLRERALDGLDADLCAALLGRGIQTLEELAACDPVDLVKDLGVGYSRLARLTSLARRQTGRSIPSAPSGTPGHTSSAKFSRAELPFASAPQTLGVELTDALKNAPARAPKDGSTIHTDSGHEGAGGPFV